LRRLAPAAALARWLRLSVLPREEELEAGDETLRKLLSRLAVEDHWRERLSIFM
jgi:hypothetical protein